MTSGYARTWLHHDCRRGLDPGIVIGSVVATRVPERVLRPVLAGGRLLGCRRNSARRAAD
jgi:hypothetical protein